MHKNIKLVVIAVLAFVMLACNEKSSKSKAQQSVKKETKPSVAFSSEIYFNAALEGNSTIIKQALDKGVNPAMTDIEGRTALMLASFNGHTDVVNLLLKKGVNVNATDNNERTALMFASTGPFVETVVALLKAGANPNAVGNVEQFTALMFAAAEGQLEVVQALLKHNADKNMIDKDGESAYDFAMSKEFYDVAAILK